LEGSSEGVMDGRVHIVGRDPHVKATSAGTRPVDMAIDPRLGQTRSTPQSL
jgi:hypothetical protein